MPVNARNPFLERRGSTLDGTELEGARSLPLDLIDVNPYQPRQVFDEAALDELAASIREHGVIEPILVRPLGDRYQVVAGERRRRAAERAELTSIPALILSDLSDEQLALITVIENLQRADLDIEDEARQLQDVLAHTGWSGSELARRLGKKPDYVNRRLALLQRPYLFTKLREGEITIKQALAHLAALTQLGTAAPTYDEAEVITLGAELLPDDSTSAPLERAELDSQGARPPPSLEGLSGQPPAPSPERIIYPWRRRPLDQFAEWVARTPPTAVPPQERAVILETIAEVTSWLERWKHELAELPTEE